MLESCRRYTSRIMNTNLVLAALFVVVAVCVGVIGAPPVTTTPATTNNIAVSIVKTKEMTAHMQLDAVEAFKRAYTHLSSNADRCSIVRQIFLEKYPEYKWHVAMYRAYSVQSVMSIDIKVNNDNFVLFATRK